MNGLKGIGSSVSRNADQLRHCINSFLTGVSFSGIALHGNVSWNPIMLAAQSLLWRMSEKKDVTASFDDSSTHCKQLFGDCAVTTYQGLMKALLRYSSQMIVVLMDHLRETVLADPKGRVAGYFPIAVDGSKPSAPRTLSNESWFVSKQYGNGKNAKHRNKKSTKKKTKKKTGKKKRTVALKKPSSVTQPVPNVLVTMFWSVGLQLPLCWTIGGAQTTEREEARKVIKTLKSKENTLLIADAGFVGYPLWSAIATANLTFLIRVGANVHLKAKNKRKGLYFYLPKSAGRRTRPLVVRLVYIKIGKTKMAMLTNELSEEALSKTTIKKFYKMRWGVEIEFRNFKQTFQCKTFHCHNAQRVIVEAHWSLLAFTLMKLWAHQQRVSAATTPEQPAVKLSTAKLLKAFGRALGNQNNRDSPELDLFAMLAQATCDSYQRKANKTARYRPKGERPKTGLPIIKNIGHNERQRLEKMLKTAA